jgi:putative membrane protein
MVDVATEDSLVHSMNGALKHYSSMFFLPSFRKAVAAIALVCIGGVGLFTFVLFPSIEGLTGSLLLGVSLFAAVLLADYITSKTILRRDPIYIFRRITALSLFCWILWLFFIILGVIVGAFFGLLLWVKLCLLGFAAVLTFRTVVFTSTSSTGVLQRLSASVFPTFLYAIAFIAFWRINSIVNPLQVLPFLVLSSVVGCAFAFFFILLLDHFGRRTYHLATIPLFRAFMLNWVAGLNAPFEEFLEKLGKNEDVEVTVLKFATNKPKAAIIVPLVHPGPFKNIGSSLLPSILKREFERAFGCDTCVPLGILGHELDLTSQAQNRRIINQVINSSKFAASVDKAKPFVKVTDGLVTASCQVFGNTAFLSFTLAPKTTEDLPQQLGRMASEEAKKLGIDCSVLVNAHNSITEIVDVDVSIDALHEVAFKCLKRAVSLPSYPFEVGAATLFPREFNLEDGMGPGGITAIVVKVAEQKTAYVVIDGNNMISGLREEILVALKVAGFHESEVFTTDTHAVSALVLGRRGYHPVGEVMDRELLINYIQQAARSAADKLEACNTGSRRLVVPKVRVIGKARLESLSLFVDKALQRAKRIVAPIFAFEGLIMILLLVLL